MELYRVLLADDEAEIRQGISRKIDWAAQGFELAGEAENGAEALELAEQIRPDVVLTDIKMPFMDGLELCRRLRRELPAAKLVVFSGFDDFEYARQAVSMGVSEYIMKPVNARELEEVLASLRTQLEAQRQQRRDMEALRRRYEESLPVLRELFFARLLDGRMPPEQLAERAARYELELPAGPWAAALVQMDLPPAGESAERDELLLLSVRSFVEEHFELEGCWLRTLLYNDAVALLAGLQTPEQLYPLMAELERLCALAPSCLGLGLTVGLGQLCQAAGQLHQSMEGALTALDYRLLMGGGRVLYIGDLEPDASLRLSLDDEDQRALATAVKLGTEGQLDATLHGLLDRVPAVCAGDRHLPGAPCPLGRRGGGGRVRAGLCGRGARGAVRQPGPAGRVAHRALPPPAGTAGPPPHRQRRPHGGRGQSLHRRPLCRQRPGRGGGVRAPAPFAHLFFHPVQAGDRPELHRLRHRAADERSRAPAAGDGGKNLPHRPAHRLRRPQLFQLCVQAPLRHDPLQVPGGADLRAAFFGKGGNAL